MNAREDALRLELKAAKSEARIKVVVYAGALLVVGLLLSTLVYSIQASKGSEEAAAAARAQSAVNAELIRGVAANSAANSIFLEQLADTNAQRRADLQDLLDTVYGAGRAVLGKPLPLGVRPISATSASGAIASLTPHPVLTPTQTVAPVRAVKNAGATKATAKVGPSKAPKPNTRKTSGK